MTAQDLAEAKAELATLRAARLQRLTGKAIASVGSTGESVAYAAVTLADIERRIVELQAEIRFADPCARGALHLC